jgi:hypothetical protein
MSRTGDESYTNYEIKSLNGIVSQRKKREQRLPCSPFLVPFFSRVINWQWQRKNTKPFSRRNENKRG